VRLEGAAVESRIYAEDPLRNFLPSTGRLVKYRPPAEGRDGDITLRNDTGVYEGGEISIYYDPMIAKLVTHAPTRKEAIAAQAQALDAFYIDGIRHNVAFLAAVMAHPRWQAGRLSTAFIAEEFPTGFAPITPAGQTARTMAAVAAAIDTVLGERKRRISGQMPGRPVVRERLRSVWLDHTEIKLEVFRDFRGITVRMIEEADSPALVLVSSWKPGEPVWRGTVDGLPVAVQVRPIVNGFLLFHRGAEAKAYVYTANEAAAARLMPIKTAADAGKQVRCPMPGLVLSIAVVAGQEVKAGETLAVIEAMKMENVLRAEQDGTIKAIHAKKGDILAVDAVILEFA
jgi:propionyl-CoA carboxylase alpha chain